MKHTMHSLIHFLPAIILLTFLLLGTLWMRSTEQVIHNQLQPIIKVKYDFLDQGN